MEKVGVEAVVKGLASFLSDLGKMDSGLRKLGGSGNLISAAFSGIGNVLSGLGREILNVVEFALGQLLANAITFIVQKLGELAKSTIEAGSEFQLLEMRLQRLNFNSVIGQVGNYEAAQRIATEATKDQLQWLQRLAATTPYDAADIANVYTLARSYGFAGEAAKGLTKDISDFASGMGLGATEIERIIINFGQMVQQGKVTQREMNDLARGAFVPVNDVITTMRKNVSNFSDGELKQLSKATGIAANDLKNIAQDTKKADDTFSKLKSTGEGVNLWMEAFSDLVEERFGGAAEQMARTFKGATDNAKDFVKSVVGFNIVKPILDTLGGKIADVLSALTAPGTFDAVSLSAKRLGEAFQGLVSDLLGLGEVDTTSIVQGILQTLNRMTDWINENKDDIIQFFKDMKQTISDVWEALKAGDFAGFLEAIGLDPATVATIVGIKDNIVKTFDTIKKWVDDNGPLIKEFFSTLGEIVAGVFTNLTGVDVGGGLEGFLAGITTFMQYVIDNQEGITTFATNLTKVWLVMQVLGFAVQILLAILTRFMAVIGILIGLIGILSIPFLAISFIIFGLIALFIGLMAAAALLGIGIALGLKLAIVKFQEFRANVGIAITAALAVIASKLGEWRQAGVNMIQGLINGVTSAAGALAAAIRSVVQAAINAALSVLDEGSPSKVFMKIGVNTMKGMALGIEDAAGIVAGTMESAMAQAVLPALNMPPMTMGYSVKNKDQLSDLQPMQKVDFQVSYDGNDYLITDIK